MFVFNVLISPPPSSASTVNPSIDSSESRVTVSAQPRMRCGMLCVLSGQLKPCRPSRPWDRSKACSMLCVLSWQPKPCRPSRPWDSSALTAISISTRLHSTRHICQRTCSTLQILLSLPILIHTKQRTSRSKGLYYTFFSFALLLPLTSHDAGTILSLSADSCVSIHAN